MSGETICCPICNCSGSVIEKAVDLDGVEYLCVPCDYSWMG